MKRYIQSSTTNSNIEYKNSISGRPSDGDSYDSWGEIEIYDYDRDIGLDYNLCIDATAGTPEDESAFYVMQYNPETSYWDSNYSEFYPYEIDFDDPNWREDVKEFAFNLLSKIVEKYT